jgi:SAM-dependent methyltransferase
MSGTAMMAHLLMERLSRKTLDRTPESHLIMDDPSQVEAFAAIVSDQGLLVPIHFYHALQASCVVKPGETVLELACGPAGQLLRMAQLNPEVRFIGLDASAGMLNIARESIVESGVANVSLMLGDMTDLSGITPASIDCVVCTMSLHHLPDLPALARAFSEMQQVLKPGGGLYIADFGRLKRKSTQKFFANDRSSEQSPQFTQDYAESLAAAFSVDEFKQAIGVMGQPFQFYPTVLAPFMLIFKTENRRALDSATCERVRAMYQTISPLQRRDFHNTARWFQLAGLALPLALDCSLGFCDSNHPAVDGDDLPGNIRGLV